VAIGDITGTLDTLEFETAHTVDPYIAHVSGAMYAIPYSLVYTSPDNKTEGWIKTVTINDSTGATALTGHSLKFDTGFMDWSDVGYGPYMIHVSGNVYVITYISDSDEFDRFIRIKTVTINDSTGAIALTGHSLNLDPNGSSHLRSPIIHVSGDVYAIAYSGSGNDGWIKTVTINGSTGAIALTGQSLEFDTSYGIDINIIHISGDVYAIAYCGSGSDGWIKTVTISGAGVIALTGHSLEFDTLKGVQSDIIHVSGDVYAISYVGPGAGYIEDGWIKTVTINSSTGAIALTGESLEFDTNDIYTPHIAYVADNVYAIMYIERTMPSTGRIITVTIDSSSGAIAATGQSYAFDTAFTDGPPIYLSEFIHVFGNAYAAVYSAHIDGWLKTIGIKTSEDLAAAHQRFTGGLLHRSVH